MAGNNSKTEMSEKQARIPWIDCAKFIAIVGVGVDHVNQQLYTNPYIAFMSYYG